MSVTILKYRSNFTPLHSKGSTVIKRGLYVGEGGWGAGGTHDWFVVFGERGSCLRNGSEECYYYYYYYYYYYH